MKCYVSRFSLYLLISVLLHDSGPLRCQQPAVSYTDDLLKTAQAGNAQSQRVLGVVYLRGLGIAKDEKTGFLWLGKAAAQGDPAAEYDLALCLREGTGITKDSRKAIEWLLKASAHNFVLAQRSLGETYSLGLGVPVDNLQAAKWFEEASLRNDAIAQFDLGVLYENDLGPDPKLAYLYFSLAKKHMTGADEKKVTSAVAELEQSLSSQQREDLRREMHLYETKQAVIGSRDRFQSMIQTERGKATSDIYTKDRSSCCANLQQEIRFCAKYPWVELTPNAALGESGTWPIPCSGRLIDLAKSKYNETYLNEGWGVNDQTLERAIEVELEFEEEVAQDNKKKEIMHKEEADRITAQGNEERQIEAAKLRKEIQKKIKEGPVPGTTTYKGMYIGEPLEALRQQPPTCKKNWGEAFKAILQDGASDACFIISFDGISIAKIVDFRRESKSATNLFLRAQYGDPGAGLYRLLDSESIPEWTLWNRRDNTQIATKRSSASWGGEQELRYNEVVVFQK